LAEGLDYTVDESGRWVFTGRYLKSRGTCCFNACRECPWGQAGKTRAQADADLRQRLADLERRLDALGLQVAVTGYRLGVLSVRPSRSVDVTGLASLGQRIQEAAQPPLTVSHIAWK
jgi:hypothetical protein